MMDDWESEVEAPPTFRPFTREELELIETRIFEKKLLAKKRAEKKAKNIAVSHIMFLVEDTNNLRTYRALYMYVVRNSSTRLQCNINHKYIFFATLYINISCSRST